MPGELPFSLNRIIYPKVDVMAFFEIAAKAGITMVELRNDLPGKGIIDGFAPEAIIDATLEVGIKILTINALQKFNIPSHRLAATEELDRLIALASRIDCPAIVFCPNNDSMDSRSQTEVYDDTVAALRVFRSRLEENGVMAYIEPLGFPESSLDSVLSAQQALEEVGAECYKIVYDTFHHYLGPDTAQQVERDLDVSKIGIVHASGVRDDVKIADLRDEHRGLLDSADRLGSLDQIDLLERFGYRGAVSFEPFAPSLADLGIDALISAVYDSVAYLAKGGRS